MTSRPSRGDHNAVSGSFSFEGRQHRLLKRLLSVDLTAENIRTVLSEEDKTS